jgi:putative membrane protein
MTTASLVCALLAALLHIYIFSMESLTWRRPATWKRFGLASQAEAETTRTLAYNQGFYNLFLALGAVAGLVALALGYSDVGWTLIFSCCGSMLLAAVVLASGGRRYLRPALIQGTMPLLAVVLGVLAITLD